MLHVQALSRTYADQPALKSVSFRIERPEVVGVLGPVGAGKTTLLKLLAGVVQPDTGSIVIAGSDALANQRAAQAATGYLPAGAPLYPDLSVQAHLRLIAHLRGLFLLLTVYTIERRGWVAGPVLRSRRRTAGTRLAVAGAGLLSLKLVLGPLRRLHIDLHGQGEGAQPLAPLSERQEVSWELITCVLIVAGLVGAGAAARAWRKCEKPLDLSERDSYAEIELIG